MELFIGWNGVLVAGMDGLTEWGGGANPVDVLPRLKERDVVSQHLVCVERLAWAAWPELLSPAPGDENR